jgi:hypothetical protein
LALGRRVANALLRLPDDRQSDDRNPLILFKALFTTHRLTRDFFNRALSDKLKERG